MEIIRIISGIVWIGVGITIIGGTIYSMRLSKNYMENMFK